MSVLKDMASRQFWISVAVTAAAALLLNALGAWLVVWGLLPVEKAWVWVSIAWGMAAFVGARAAASGKEQTLLRGALNAAVTIGLLWIVGLTTPGTWGGEGRWIWYLAAAAAGAFLAALMPAGRRRSKRQGRGRQMRAKAR